uniref:Uncharacterized protein n=1 Tax=Oryctolagus cuniculus TaxID=9986 RepID=A0A5F9D385_RABIT
MPYLLISTQIRTL